ncbi:glucose dehydrogenase [Escherichia coli]|uniref:Glucose dehydrogenase n=1 Tax=Escherichia coli TaxID=562 RepID=A0A376K5K5_ECOLX|nr:glucose dehydrogenase [Escherichia coli]
MLQRKPATFFVLDRRNGELVVPAPEKPVPQGAAKGDYVTPTQPFSELSFRPTKDLSGADMWEPPCLTSWCAA